MRRLQADGSFLASNKEGFLTRRSLTGRWWCEEYEVIKVMYAVKPDGDRKAPSPSCSTHGMYGELVCWCLGWCGAVGCFAEFEEGSGASSRCKKHVVYLMESRWVLE